jgi:hypothetical protein
MRSRGMRTGLGGKARRKRPLGRLRRRLDVDIEMDLGERGWGGLSCIYLAQNID